MTEPTIKKNVKVVVLGDIGRSPRMQYHALSLASCGFFVNIIGYVETTPLADILENPNITVTKLHPLKLESAPKNPPAIPTLPVCRFYCLVTRTKFVIDWHNYAYTIMAISLQSNHPFLKISTYIEKYFGQCSDSNLCVTYAMKTDLLENWNIIATVLYDRPPQIFHPITLEDKHKWFLKIGQEFHDFSCQKEYLNKGSAIGTEETAFTEKVDNSIRLKDDRPALLFSSTSWTPDEDFSILMDALHVYETTYNLTNKLPKLICVITGKGPMKEHYKNEMAVRKWQHIKVVTPWLEPSDYPIMVASADLGVCLHTSSSGLDLPMKVVDMFGAGLPVCACEFKCIDELVLNGENGYTFKTSNELSKQIVTWFEEFPNNWVQNKVADEMRKNLRKFQDSRWEDNWNLRAKKFFED